MSTTNSDIAAAFEQVADLLELQDANPFRVCAYRNPARVIGDLKLDLPRSSLQASRCRSCRALAPTSMPRYASWPRVDTSQCSIA